jgi:hypothetical protein
MTEDQQALDEVRSTLLEITRDGLQSRPDGVLLTYVGTEWVKRKNAPFEQYLTILAIQQKLNAPPAARKMVPFIQSYCSDLFELSKTQSGIEVLRLKDSDQSDNAVRATTFSNHKFKKAVWAAFLRPLPEGYKRFLSIDTLGFTDVKRKPGGGVWVEIPRDLITETPMDQPIDGPLVQARVTEWIERNNLDVEVLLDLTPAGDFGRPTLGDLIRIIDALPETVSARWMIPADVLRNLRLPS